MGKVKAKRPSIRDCNTVGLRVLSSLVRYGGDDMEKRRALVFAAGVANNVCLLKGLGSQESSIWYEGRRMTDPNYRNPYWPDAI
jgi:hypothetical protein